MAKDEGVVVRRPGALKLAEKLRRENPGWTENQVLAEAKARYIDAQRKGENKREC